MTSPFSSRPRLQRFLMTMARISLGCLPLTIGFICAAQTEIKARKAEQFVGSMGVNVHLESPYLPYNSSKYPKIDLELESLGMHHVRDEINNTGDSFVKQLNYLGMLGYSVCGVIEGGNDYPQVGTNLDPGVVGPMIGNLHTLEAVEGPNEPDDTPPPFVYGLDYLYYPAGAINESENLWDIVQGDPKISSLPVLAMSEGSSGDFRTLAAFTNHAPVNYANFGNMHAYQGGQVGDSGLTNLYIPDVLAWVGNKKPLWTTEMGYHNYTKYLSDGEQQGVSERASAIYLPIAFLSGFNANVVQTFSYELLDEVDDPQLTHACTQSPSGVKYCSGEGHYGLLNFDGAPKPAFRAMKSLIEILQEPKALPFDPGSLKIAFSGAPHSMRYTLLEKSNGDYYLAIWNDKSVYQIAKVSQSGAIVPGKDIDQPKVPITINFDKPLTFTVYAPNDSTGTNPTDAYTISTTLDSIQIDLPAKVLLIKITRKK
jgi:hypothetical protein